MSIKVKVLFGLTLILILAIASNLFFSNYLITADKKAYIFENILKNSEELNKSIDNKIREALIQSEAFILGSQSGDAQWNQLFDKQVLIDGLIYSFDSSNAKRGVLKKTFTESAESYGEFVEEWSKNVNFIESDGLEIKKIQDKNILEVSYRQDSKSLALLINMQEIWEKISNDYVFNYIYLDRNRNVLWSTSNENTLKAIVQEIGAKNLKNLTTELKIGNESYLLSTQTIQGLDLQLISFIPSSKAYAVLKSLGLKTMSFGLSLLGVALLLGLFFSIKLTNPIKSLVQGTQFISEGNFDQKVVINTRDELRFLGDKFNEMGEKIYDLLNEKESMIIELREAKDKIEDYSKNLEKMVAERTAELKSANDFIQAMINSLDQGLMVFDEKLDCAPIYTKACESLFGVAPSNKNFCDVLGFSPEQKEKTLKWADILFSEKIPFESAAQLGPKEKKYGEDPESENFKSLSIHYYPMRDEEEKISNVVAVVTDKTEEKRAIEQTRKKERYVEMIYKILATKKQFIDFLNESEDFLRSLNDALMENPPNIDQAMLVYHSMNGGFGMYGVDDMVNEARVREQFIVDLKEQGKDPAEFQRQLVEQKDEYMSLFEIFKNETFRTLGMSSDVKEIDKALLLYISDLVKETKHKELIYVFDERINKEPISDFLAPYRDLIQSLAMKLGKEIEPLKIINGDLRVDPENFKEFFSLLVHLFRNCVDHGIENPFKRGELGKNQQGTISVESQILKEENKIRIVVSDDGGGISAHRIREKLKEKRPDDWSIDDESDNQIIYHIFDQDFSTAEAVTSISGRGVGMSAIKDVVDRMNGKIVLETIEGQGSRFTFELPIS